MRRPRYPRSDAPAVSDCGSVAGDRRGRVAGPEDVLRVMHVGGINVRRTSLGRPGRSLPANVSGSKRVAEGRCPRSRRDRSLPEPRTDVSLGTRSFAPGERLLPHGQCSRPHGRSSGPFGRTCCPIGNETPSHDLRGGAERENVASETNGSGRTRHAPRTVPRRSTPAAPVHRRSRRDRSLPANVRGRSGSLKGRPPTLAPRSFAPRERFPVDAAEVHQSTTAPAPAPAPAKSVSSFAEVC